MSEPTTDNLVLKRLREIRTLLGEVREDTADTRLRVGILWAGYASVSLRLDRLAADVEPLTRQPPDDPLRVRGQSAGHA